MYLRELSWDAYRTLNVGELMPKPLIHQSNPIEHLTPGNNQHSEASSSEEEEGSFPKLVDGKDQAHV